MRGGVGFGLLLCAVTAACASDGSEKGSVTSGGGSAGAAGTTSGSGGNTSSGAPGQAGSGGAGLDMIARLEAARLCGTRSTDYSCSSDDDCCVALDGCMATLWLTTVARQADVLGCLSKLESQTCFSCIPPAMQVSCRSGQCVAEELLPTEYPQSQLAPATKSHCGRLDIVGFAGASTMPGVAGSGSSMAGASGLVAGGGNAAALAQGFSCR